MKSGTCLTAGKPKDKEVVRPQKTTKSSSVKIKAFSRKSRSLNKPLDN